MILRNFLFLDTAMVGDYLSQLEGSVAGGDIDQTTTERTQRAGKASVRVVEGSLGSEALTETRQRGTITDAALFQRLYDLLEADDSIQVLDAFDEQIWGQLRRGEILEVQADIRVPQPLLLTQAVENVAPWIDILTTYDKDPLADAGARTAFEGFRAVRKITEGKPVPIVFKAASTPGFSFIAHLPRQYLRCDLNDLQGEAAVFGKLQRIVPKGQQVEAFSLVSGLTSLPTMSREQRRKVGKDATDKNLAEVVRGPAIVLTPVAVYR